MRDGFFDLSFSGHGREDVCAAVSAVMLTAARGLRAIAADYPKQLAFEEDVSFKGRTRL